MKLPLLALLVAAALSVAACSRPTAVAPSAPKPRPSPYLVPIAQPSEQDRELVDTMLGARAWSGNEKTPLMETTTVPDVATLRARFPATLVPVDTLGRRLVAIVFQRALVDNMDPRDSIRLVYEGQVIVSQARYESGPVGPLKPPNPTRETTTVGAEEAEVEIVPEAPSDEATRAIVKWQVGRRRYFAVSGVGMAKDEVVRIARSLAP